MLFIKLSIFLYYFSNLSFQVTRAKHYGARGDNAGTKANKTERCSPGALHLRFLVMLHMFEEFPSKT